MNKIAFLTANLGNFDKFIDNVDQSIDYDFYRFTDKNFPPRFCSMTPRLQARIPKLFGYEMAPGYDYYIWLDSSCILSHRDSIKWLIEKCENKDMVVFKHPNRKSIREEACYLVKRLDNNCPYITPRYKNELLKEQLEVIEKDVNYVDDHLFASTCIVYKNKEKVINMMKEWWQHVSRYHSIDQLSFPYVIWKNNCKVRVIKDSYLKTPYLKYIRK